MIAFEVELTRGAFALHAALASDAQAIGLFGPSGSGKSTLLNVLTGGLRPAQGRIVVNERCLLDTEKGIDVPMRDRRIGMVYQDGRLFPHLSVKNNLMYGMRLLKPADRRFQFQHVVDLLEIGPLLSQHPGQLSGGERQRVALGRALLASPEILLLDEPMAALDERLKAQILPFLRRVREETRVPMMYVSHALQEMVELAQQVAVMQEGKILACGHFHEVLVNDAVLPFAHALGLDNVLRVTLTEQHEALGCSVAQCGTHAVTFPYFNASVGTPLSLVIPASGIAMARDHVPGISIQNQIPGKVSSIRTLGHRALVEVDISHALLVEVTEKAVRDLDITVGATVYCLIKAQSIQPFRVSI
jgi:molybdate transport system ATP-binding protein